MGYGKDDPRRCRSGILYTLGQIADEGHCFATEEQLLGKAMDLLEVGGEAVCGVLGEMVEAGDVIKTGRICICLPSIMPSAALPEGFSR